MTVVSETGKKGACPGRLPGLSRFLPTAASLGVLEAMPDQQRVSVCVSDRKDFYHQFSVSPQRAATNALWPCLHGHDVLLLRAYKRHVEGGNAVRFDRPKHGDAIGARISKPRQW